MSKKVKKDKKAAKGAKARSVITTVPGLTEPRAAAALRVKQATLESGLSVVAVRKPGVPLVEMRLRIPFLSAKPGHPAQGMVLSETMLTGARDLDRAELAGAIQGLGADLTVSVDADRLVLGGSVLSGGLPRLLDLVAGVLTEPAYAADEVATERGRAVETLNIARARAAVIASEALERRMWGDHPYALDLPTPAEVAAVTAPQLKAMHRSLVRPGTATLVLVGDLTPDRMINLASTSLTGWTGTGTKPRVRKLPTPPAGPLLVVDRPGSVQSSLKMGRPGLTRKDPDYPALQLANLIFGGYFSSRWTLNIREDKGYTYGPHSRVNHHVLGSTVNLDVEAATEVTAPTVLETTYELGRLASLGVTDAEVEAARQYAIGTLSLSVATQAGLASTLSALAAFDLGLGWIAEHPGRLLAATTDDVSAAAARFFSPTGFTGVVVGEAATVTEPLAALVEVE
ncbi:pitrilysin family protein [Jatrophihabitans endophyticus]|uniref:M16 family metallopeptidase n=1 Tax=Jatrophihabitans endophyticus TaxID=1206085 RepID=UPI0019D9C7F2|nr:pitrilysin family protein [Jatrophihabitans endophyticus]MBE7188157.1 insulinase family protein [Jatrophihabitans endophyticus]